MTEPCPYEIWFYPHSPEVLECVLGRYPTRVLADRVAQLPQAVLTEGEVEVETDDDEYGEDEGPDEDSN
jgi:hypothetical protein